ncbi:hypothetical protein AX15_000787 [Amanita polypyramis BW_CC]|nr:hypothetical protein AX15_000787 [Amanita polypyramis BW_CC]
MSFPISISFPPPSLEATVSPFHVCSFRGRPRGLWRARVTASRISSASVPDRKEKSPHPISDTDDDEACATPCLTQPLRPHKKPRLDSSPDCTSSSDHEGLFWDFTRSRSLRRRVSRWTNSMKKMDTSSTARRGTALEEKTTCDLDDWDDLKELFARAAEQYEGSDATEALPLLRGTVHECHRFLRFHPDPSALFVDTVSGALQPDPKSRRDRLTSSITTGSQTFGEEQQGQRKTIFIELPTAFHALFGTTLFLLGNLIAQEPSLALEGEPTNPVFYWLAALDVFEIGENLPSRTSGMKHVDVPEDWHMAVIWGRSLVCLADDLLNNEIQAKKEGKEPTSTFLDIEEPNWPQESPFYTIAAQRQPITRRLFFSSATPNDLLALAMDQFSRGIFHMPHELKSHNWPTVWSAAPMSGTPRSSAPSSLAVGDKGGLPARFGQNGQFSRLRELFTIASEVLFVAEKLDVPSERHYWANWADSVLGQVKVEADRNAWRSLIPRSRGRCRLIVGSAYIDEIEDALERGEMDILKSEEAEEAREDLSLAIEYFEKARAEEEEGSRREEPNATGDPELGSLLVEALVTLANLTEDVHQREVLYTRAKVEAGSDMDLDLDADDDTDDKMDESH